jgi:hypothetical protein
MTADADIQLEDLLESYPPVTIPGFQTLINAKKEFRDMFSPVGEKLPPGRGQFFKHQIFTHRFLRAYDETLDLSSTGVGKSCKFLGFIEYTIKERLKKKTDPKNVDEKVAHFDKILILVKNETQKNEIKNQIICKCSDGHYLTENVKNAKDSAQRRAISSELKKAGYKIETTRKFVSRVLKHYPETQEGNIKMANDFADTFFWFDEAHNLIKDPGATDKREKDRVYNQIWRVLHLALRRKVVLSTATPMINGPEEIGTLMNLILPADGTLPRGYDYINITDNDFRTFFPGYPYNPRVTDRNTWITYFRGKFPADYKLQNPDVDLTPYIRNDLEKHFKGQIPTSFNYNTASLQDFEPYFRGRIGYIRATSTGAVPVEQGELIEDEVEFKNGKPFISNLTVAPSWMSEHQTEGYLNAFSKGSGELYSGSRQASNFVFPDGSFGNGISEEEKRLRKQQRQARKAVKKEQKIVPIKQLPEKGIVKSINPLDTEAVERDEIEFANENNIEKRGFRRYVEELGDDMYRATPEFADYISTIDNISVLSCKFANIIEHVANEPGNCFVYGEYVKGSGSVVLGLCLEQMGFVRYNETSSVFLSDTHSSTLCGMGATGSSAKNERDTRITKGVMRYALLTGEITDPKFVSMMETMNSYENRHGELIKVLISSKSGRDGINVSNVLQIHLIGPEWNQSSMYQAQSRGIRATSHEDLIDEEKERLQNLSEEEKQQIINEGGDPYNPRIEIKIYKHVAMPLEQSSTSIDLMMYHYSEDKDRQIKRVMRIMKQCAIGCQINKKRNIRQPPDINYSAECDYDVCEYKCVDPEPDGVDYSTYDVVYSAAEITEATRSITNLFKLNNSFTIEDITSILSNERKKYIIVALEKLITNKIPIRDRFGYKSYLREDDGTFYLDRTYPSGINASYSMSYYTKGIIGIQQEKLSDVVVTLESPIYEKIFSELENMDPNDPEFDKKLSSISIDGQALIVEEVIKREMLGIITPLTEAITRKFQRMIFVIHDPVTEIDKVYEGMSDNKPKRGRKKKTDVKRRMTKHKTSKMNIVEDETTEQVVIHTLYSQVPNQTSYSSIARFNKGEGRTRILKPSEIRTGWRDISQVELPVYNKYVQYRIAQNNKAFEDKGIYGFILPDGKFRIRDKLSEDPGAEDDDRQKNRGKVCKSWSKPRLIDIMWEIGIPAPEGQFQTFKESDRRKLVESLFTSGAKKKIEELYALPLEQLVWYYKWHSTKKVKKPDMCEKILLKMKEDGRLMRMDGKLDE